MKNDFLSAETLLQGDILKKERVQISRGYVFVREMTGKEKDVWEQSIMRKVPSGDPKKPVQYETNLEDFRAKLAIVTICDESGKLLFKFNQYKELNDKLSADSMDKIIQAAMKLNAISKEDQEEILKNSKEDL